MKKWTENNMYGIDLEELTLKDEFKKEDFWDTAENMEKFWRNHENITCYIDDDNKTCIGIIA